MRQHKNGIQKCFFSREILVKLSNAFCFDFGWFSSSAIEIKREADT